MHPLRKTSARIVEGAFDFGSLERQAAEIPDGVDKLRFLRSSIRREEKRARLWKSTRICGCAILVGVLAAGVSRSPVLRNVSVRAAGNAPSKPAEVKGAANVWLVERNANGSIYSNGLQVRNDFETQGPPTPRRFLALTRANLEPADVRTSPVGIVYHTSESLMAPFEPHRNESLKHYSLGLLASARQKRLYNFVIDRFGRVFRVVPEMQAANHAGHSVWADASYIYVNLNQSFIGISFEAQTGAGLPPEVNVAEVNAAQVHAGQVLTQMLRSAYGIAGNNCVTHAQVSVNPSNMNIGYHTDWASHFPFREIGLSEGYQTQVAGISIFGFRYDSTFLEAIGGTPWKGLISAEEQIVHEAASRGMTPEVYRKTLQKKYKEAISGMSNMAAAEETHHGQS